MTAITKNSTSVLIIDSNEGLILNNEHLIRDASCVIFIWTDGRKYIAEVKVTDEIVDLAVLFLLTSRSSEETEIK